MYHLSFYDEKNDSKLLQNKILVNYCTIFFTERSLFKVIWKKWNHTHDFYELLHQKDKKCKILRRKYDSCNQKLLWIIFSSW